MKRLKKIPHFESEDEERKFWSRRDSSAYIDYRKVVRASFPNLKPSSRTISIRLPESLLDGIKVIANRADVPYQSMMKVLLDEKVSEVLGARRRKKPAA
jgi:predicted DNA binding CopG/RHH family protein